MQDWGEAELGNCAMCVKPDATMKAISSKAELGICACVKPDATMKEIFSEELTNEWNYLIASALGESSSSAIVRIRYGAF